MVFADLKDFQEMHAHASMATRSPDCIPCSAAVTGQAQAWRTCLLQALCCCCLPNVSASGRSTDMIICCRSCQPDNVTCFWSDLRESDVTASVITVWNQACWCAGCWQALLAGEKFLGGDVGRGRLLQAGSRRIHQIWHLRHHPGRLLPHQDLRQPQDSP